MKYTLALVVLAAVAAVCNSSIIKATPRSNLNVGFRTPEDRLLHSEYVSRGPTPGTVQTEEVSFVGSDSDVISWVHATEQGDTQTAAVWITSGGLGLSSVTVKIHAYQGEGYNYLLEVWGH